VRERVRIHDIGPQHAAVVSQVIEHHRERSVVALADVLGARAVRDVEQHHGGRTRLVGGRRARRDGESDQREHHEAPHHAALTIGSANTAGARRPVV